MINLMENKVLAPLLQQRYEEGLKLGREEAQKLRSEQECKLVRLEQQEILLVQLSDKFGAVSPWAVQQLTTASLDELYNWRRRIIRAASLEETLR